MESLSQDSLNKNFTSKVQTFPSEWLISFKNPKTLWAENWFAVVFEVVCAIVVLQIFRNAKRKGGEAPYLVLCAMVSTLCFEILPFLRPGYELWWFHKGLVNVLRARVPSYVISLFVIIHHVSDSLTKQSKLPRLTRSFVTAVIGILIVSPFLWFAPRLLLITFHLDDPVFQDRLLTVPWIQILIVLLLLFHTSHLFEENCDALLPNERNSYNYFLCALQSGLVATIYTIIEQYLLYILLNLTVHLNTGTCVLAALVVLACLAKAEIESLQMSSISTSGVLQPLKNKAFWITVSAYLLLTTLPLWLQVENLKSMSERQELGPCHITQNISNTSPLEVTRHRFVCLQERRHQNFDFHCVDVNDISLGAKKFDKFYTICGKPLSRTPTMEIMIMYSAICTLVIYTMMRLTFTFKVEQKQEKVVKDTL